MKSFVLTSLVLLALAGCRSYEAKPVDWEAEAKAGATNVVVFASLDEVGQAAVIGNPGLNLLRLKRANSVRVATAAGWWNDPELDFDALHFLKPGDNPFLTGASVVFTIPLSGVPGCEKKAAGFYADADAAAVRAAELDVAVEARKTVVRLAALRARAQVLRSFDADARVRQAFVQAEKLCAAGEVAARELAAARRRRHGRAHGLRTLEREAMAAEAALVKQLGLLPGVNVKLPSTKWHAEHGKIKADSNPLTMIRHPRVQEALARLDGDEAALDAEIRRQYPELKLGPAYEREEGIDRLGIVAGVTLPLWNRNRKGIAVAEGTRDAARMTAVGVWRGLVQDFAAARAALANLIDHPPEPASERDQAERLAAAGELGPLDYLAVREELCDFELEEAQWHADVCAAEEELRRFETR